MTLIISIITKGGIYGSSDFHLISLPRKQLLPYDSVKQVNLHYLLDGHPSWSGYITYSGIGEYRGLSTSDWICTLFQGQRYVDFDSALDKLRVEGARWLEPLDAHGRRHSFFVAAFVEGKPRFALVSNFQKIGGHDKQEAAPTMYVQEVKRFRDSNNPRILVSGLRQSVTRTEMKLLRRKVSNNESSEVIENTLARINKNASVREQSRGISAACYTYSILATGSAGSHLYGQGRTELIPSFIMNGEVIGPTFIKDLFAQI